MEENLKIVEGEIMPIYENNKGERLINARELHKKLENKRKFSDWIKQRIEHYDFIENSEFIRFHNFVKGDEKGNQYYQIYYKPKATKEIIEWFNENKEEMEYKVIYERNTKNGKKGEVKEKGYKIENVCYKVKI